MQAKDTFDQQSQVLFPELLSRHSSPNPECCVGLLWPKSRTQNFPLFHLIPSTLAHQNSLSRCLCRAFLSSRRTILPFPSFQNYEFHYLMVTENKAASDISISNMAPRRFNQALIRNLTPGNFWIGYGQLCCSYSRYQGVWSPPWGSGPVNVRLLRANFRRPYPPIFPGQVAYNGYSLYVTHAVPLFNLYL